MTYDILFLIINRCISPIIEGYILLKISSYLLKKRYNFKYLDLLLIIGIAITIEITLGWNVSKTLYQQILVFLISMLIVSINYDGSIYKKIISYGLFICIMIVGDTITLMLLLFITNLDANDIFGSSYYYTWAVIISKTMLIVFIKIYANKVIKKSKNVNFEYKAQISLLLFFILIAIFLLLEILQGYVIDEYTIDSLDIIISFVLLGASAIGIYMFYTILKETKRQAEQQQIIEQYKLEHKYTQELNMLLDNLRILKHDLKNHISCMWGLIETDNIEDFKLYLANLTDEIEEISENEITRNINI